MKTKKLRKETHTQKKSHRSAESLPRAQCNVINAALAFQLFLPIIVSHPLRTNKHTHAPLQREGLDLLSGLGVVPWLHTENPRRRNPSGP